MSLSSCPRRGRFTVLPKTFGPQCVVAQDRVSLSSFPRLDEFIVIPKTCGPRCVVAQRRVAVFCLAQDVGRRKGEGGRAARGQKRREEGGRAVRRQKRRVMCRRERLKALSWGKARYLLFSEDASGGQEISHLSETER